MLRKILLRRLGRKLDRAVKLGAMTAEEAAEVRGAANEEQDWLTIIEMIMMIIELILDWLQNR